MQTVRIYRLEDLDWRTRWPDRDDLQREIKGAVCAAQPIDPDGLPAVSRQRPGYQAVASDRPAAPLSLPPQTVHDGAVARPGKRLIIPMDRGRKSFSFHLPEHIGSCILYSRSHRCRLRTR